MLLFCVVACFFVGGYMICGRAGAVYEVCGVDEWVVLGVICCDWCYNLGVICGARLLYMWLWHLIF